MACPRGHRFFARRRWTEAEEALLRRYYPTHSPDDIAGMFRGRSRASIISHALHIGVSNRPRRWTATEDRRLREMLADAEHPRDIARAFGRPWSGIVARAVALGIRLGPPQGFASIEAMARRTGFDAVTLRRILHAEGVTPRIRVGATLGGRGALQHRMVDEVDALEAVERWMSRENVGAAARVRGLVGDTLRGWLVAAGETPPEHRKHWRVATATIDRVVAEHRPASRPASRRAA